MGKKKPGAYLGDPLRLIPSIPAVAPELRFADPVGSRDDMGPSLRPAPARFIRTRDRFTLNPDFHRGSPGATDVAVDFPGSLPVY